MKWIKIKATNGEKKEIIKRIESKQIADKQTNKHMERHLTKSVIEIKWNENKTAINSKPKPPKSKKTNSNTEFNAWKQQCTRVKNEEKKAPE